MIVNKIFDMIMETRNLLWNILGLKVLVLDFERTCGEVSNRKSTSLLKLTHSALFYWHITRLMIQSFIFMEE